MADAAEILDETQAPEDPPEPQETVAPGIAEVPLEAAPAPKPKPAPKARGKRGPDKQQRAKPKPKAKVVKAPPPVEESESEEEEEEEVYNGPTEEEWRALTMLRAARNIDVQRQANKARLYDSWFGR